MSTTVRKARETFTRGTSPRPASAVTGDPFRATAEKDEELFRRMTGHLADFVRAARQFPVEVVFRNYPERACMP